MVTNSSRNAALGDGWSTLATIVVEDAYDGIEEKCTQAWTLCKDCMTVVKEELKLFDIRGKKGKS